MDISCSIEGKIDKLNKNNRTGNSRLDIIEENQ